MKSVLLTGFEAFGPHASNPSAEIASHFNGHIIADHRITGVVLACEYENSIRQLRSQIRRTNPSLVICLGLAAGRSAITPERVAVNVDDAALEDNAGVRHAGTPIVTKGPVAYWSTLPIKAIVAALVERGIPATVSQTAGTFVCNHVFYGLMHHLKRRPSIRGGFIHLPAPEGFAGDFPTLPFEMLRDGVGIAIETSLRIERDIVRADGATH
jgi:pyroglutamyl-peptidase